MALLFGVTLNACRPSTSTSDSTIATIKWKWEKGEVLRYKESQEYQLVDKQGNITSGSKTTSVISHKVIDIDNQGIVAIQRKCESIKVTEVNPAKEEKILLELTKDDDKKIIEYPQRIQEMFKPFEVRIAKNGEIKYVEGLDKQKEEREERLMEGLRNSSGDNAIKPYISVTFYTFKPPVNAYFCFT